MRLVVTNRLAISCGNGVYILETLTPRKKPIVIVRRSSLREQRLLKSKKR